jgi:single-strand DNA-binding protein
MANFNFNKVILGGRLTADPELKTTPGGVSVTVFTVAVNRKSAKEAADFLNVIAWRQTAEFVTRYFRKASSICVVGSVQSRSWTDKNGVKQFATEIVADEVFFVDTLRESPLGRNNSDVIVDPSSPVLAGVDLNAAPGKAQAQMYATPGARAGIAGEESDMDGELPF